MRPSSRPRLGGVAALATSLGLVAGGLVVSGAASAQAQPTAAPPTSPCPDAFPADELTLGQEATGLTVTGIYRRDGVSQGSTTEPQEFTATYVDTIRDDTGDLLVFDLEGLNITKPDGSVDAGVWAGISGSPVYAADGRLIGAVSYSFADGVSSRGGITPAADLYAQRDLAGADAGAEAPQTKRLSTKQQARLVQRGGKAAGTSSGSALRRLAPPTLIGSVKGLRDPASTLATLAQRSRLTTPVLGGGNASAGSAPASIVPGGNVGFAVSNGSLPLYDVGTATAVCDATVVAYGHPAYFAPLSRTMNAASAVGVEATAFGSFKLANLGPVVGRGIADGLHGVIGRLGGAPAGTELTTTTTGVRPRTSTTQVVEPEALGFAAAVQTARDIAVAMDRDAGGEAAVSWTIDYLLDGEPRTLERGNRYTSRDLLSEEAANGVAEDIYVLQSQPFSDVEITKVAVSTVTSPAYKALRIGALKVRTGNKWVPVKSGQRLTLPRGKYLRVHATLAKADRFSSATPSSVEFRVKAPSARSTAVFELDGTENYEDEWFEEDYYYDEDEEYYFDEDDEESIPTSFADVLAYLAAAPRQDDVTGTWSRVTPTVERTTVTNKRRSAVVFGAAHLRFTFR